MLDKTGKKRLLDPSNRHTAGRRGQLTLLLIDISKVTCPELNTKLNPVTLPRPKRKNIYEVLTCTKGRGKEKPRRCCRVDRPSRFDLHAHIRQTLKTVLCTPILHCTSANNNHAAMNILCLPHGGWGRLRNSLE